VNYASHLGRNSRLARKDRFKLSRQSRDWSKTAQIDFLAEAYNGVLDLFALPKAGDEEIKNFLPLKLRNTIR